MTFSIVGLREHSNSPWCRKFKKAHILIPGHTPCTAEDKFRSFHQNDAKETLIFLAQGVFHISYVVAHLRQRPVSACEMAFSTTVFSSDTISLVVARLLSCTIIAILFWPLWQAVFMHGVRRTVLFVPMLITVLCEKAQDRCLGDTRLNITAH